MSDKPPPYPGQPGQYPGYPPPGQPYPQAQYPPTGQQYPPPNQQYPPPGQYGPPPPGPQTVVVTQAPTVVVTGNCPSCRIGNLHEEYNICGIILAILFFPLGIICCLMMTEKRCSHCGRVF